MGKNEKENAPNMSAEDNVNSGEFSEEQPYGDRPLYDIKSFDKAHEEAKREYERECMESDREDAQSEDEAEQSSKEAMARVERLNGVFDRLLLPMIIFTVALLVAVAFIPRMAQSCAHGSCAGSAETEQQFDFYEQRKHLHADMADYQSALEEGGYLVMAADEEGNLLAYKQLDSGVEIMDGIVDSHGTPYTALMLTTGEGEAATEITLMVYTRTVMLAIAERGGETRSAVYESDTFAPDPSNSDITAVSEWVSSEQLASMLSQYMEDMSAVLRK